MTAPAARIKSNTGILLLVLCMGLVNSFSISASYIVNPCGNCTCIDNQSSADCSRKNLRYVPEDLPRDIKELNLSFNIIDLSEKGRPICSKYPKLKKLYLEGNEATVISNIFQGCGSLRELNLKGNILDTLDSYTTQDLQHLKSLTSLEVLKLKEGALSNLRELEILDLTWHGIAIPPGVFKGLQSLKKLTLTLQKAILLPQQLFDLSDENDLIKLQLRGPKVKAFPASMLAGLNELKYLHLDLPSLLELKLSRHEKPKDLQTLEIHNVISLSEDILFGFKSLEKVRLHAIQKLPRTSLFQQAHFLKEIEVAACTMTSLPKGWLSNLMSLEMLNLSDNGLETLDPGDFVGLKSLKDLVLSRNRIKELPRGILSPVHKTLQQLLINHNQIESLLPGAILQMNSLQVVDLSYNNIKHIASTAFSHLPQLRQLQLEGNYIESLSQQTFASTPKLQVLNLAENVITIFPESVIKNSITQLALSSNRLMSIPGEKLCQVKNLKMLDMADNPIVCDCEVRKLPSCLPDLTVEGKCSGPLEVGGWPMMYLIPCPTDSSMDTTTGMTTTTKPSTTTTTIPTTKPTTTQTTSTATTTTTTITTPTPTTSTTTTTTPATTVFMTTTTTPTNAIPPVTTSIRTLPAPTTTTTPQTIKRSTSTITTTSKSISIATQMSSTLSTIKISTETPSSTSLTTRTKASTASTTKTPKPTTSSTLIPGVVDVVLPVRGNVAAAFTSASGRETGIDLEDVFENNFDAYPEILRPIVETDITIKKPRGSGHVKRKEESESPVPPRTLQAPENGSTSQNVIIVSSQPPVVNTSTPLSGNSSTSELESLNISNTSGAPTVDKHTEAVGQDARGADQQVATTSSGEDKRARPMHAEVSKNSADDGAYLSQAGNITLAIFVSMALMVGVLTGIWMYKKNGQSGSFNTHQDSDHFMQLQRFQQIHPPNQKRSNMTRENRD